MNLRLTKKSANDVFWNYASVITCGLSGLALILCIGANFGPSILGAFNIVFAFYIILSQVAAFGVHHSVLKHVAEFAHDAKLRRFIFSSGLIDTIPLALCVSICLWLLRYPISNSMNSPAVAIGLGWAALGLFFFALNKVLLAALNALSRFKEYALFMTLRYIFMISALLAMIASGQDGESVALILPVAECALFCLLFYALLGEMQWGEMTVMRKWMTIHLHFGFRGFGGNLMLDLNTRVDVLCLGLFASDRVVGIYSMAAILAEALYQLPLVLRTVYNPRVIQMLSRHAYGPLQALILKTKTIVWTGMGLSALIGVTLYPNVIPLISGNSEYAEGVIIFGVIMAGIVIASGYIPFGMLLINAGYPGLQTGMIVLLLLINVAGNFLLIPYFGSLGAACATSATHVFSLILLKYFTMKCLHLKI